MSEEKEKEKENTECQPCTPCPTVIKFWILGLVAMNTIIVAVLAWQWVSRIFGS